ncbi:hypothetical protein, partial [Mycolicibacterium phocaicum]
MSVVPSLVVAQMIKQENDLPFRLTEWLTRVLTPSVGHAESRKIGGGSEMIDTDGKEELPGR